MDTLLYAGLLLFTFYALSRVVEGFFVESLEIISSKLKLSSDIAGATFMAVGSSAPELFVSILALFQAGSAQAIGAGTIVGSAIFNILVIIGASALYRRAVLTWQPVIRDLLFYVGTIVLLLYTFIDGKITLSDASLYLGVYVLYLLSFGAWRKLFPYTIEEKREAEYSTESLGTRTLKLSRSYWFEITGYRKVKNPLYLDGEHAEQIRSEPWKASNILDKLLAYVFVDLSKHESKYLYNFGMAIAFIAGLSHLMVDSAVHVAHAFGVPEVIIGLTILAAGTSVPDLMSSIVVAKRGQGDMAIANAVGSNIFDIAIGLGAPWLAIILLRGEDVPVVTENLSSSIVLLLATVVALLFILVAKKWEIGRYAGVLLIASYVMYVLTQIGWMSFEVCVGNGFCFGL